VDDESAYEQPHERIIDLMVARKNPADLQATPDGIEALKRELAEQRRQFQFELRLLDLSLAHIFDFLKTIESKDDIVEACMLVRANVATLIESAAQKFTDEDGKSP
jgi:hypothetical protein